MVATNQIAGIAPAASLAEQIVATVATAAERAIREPGTPGTVEVLCEFLEAVGMFVDALTALTTRLVDVRMGARLAAVRRLVTGANDDIGPCTRQEIDLAERLAEVAGFAVLQAATRVLDGDFLAHADTTGPQLYELVVQIRSMAFTLSSSAYGLPTAGLVLDDPLPQPP